MNNRIISIGIVGLLVIGGFFGLFIATDQVRAVGPTYVSGSISADTTWYQEDSPYIVKGDITVEPGFTLTIEPGVEVRFDGPHSIIVDGTLIADGTSASRITFTSNKSSPAKGDWYAIRLRTDNNVMDHTEIEYASYGIFITFFGGNNTISNTTINYCKFDGIYITNSNYNVINNCTVSSNDRYGITLYESDHTDLVKSTIQYNHNFGVYLNASRYTEVTECNISYTDGKGILLYSNSHSTTISDSEISHNNHIGIDLSGASYNTIINSIIRWNNGTGIDFGGQTSNQWIENTIIMNNNDTGIDLKGSSNVNIIGCNISENKGLAGIFSWEAVSHISIFETEVWNNSGDGIWVKNGESMNIRDSKFIANEGNGIHNKGGLTHQNNIIQNCIISENKRNGIYFECKERIQYNTVIDNTVSLNIQNGIFFHVSPDGDRSNNYIRDNILDANMVYSNGLRGIYFYLSPKHDSGPHWVKNNNLYSNIIYSNFKEGIRIETECSASYSYIVDNNIYSNIISNNEYGIFLFISDTFNDGALRNNNIFVNNISGNQIGIYFQALCRWNAYIQKNNINSNNISNNQEGIYLYAYSQWAVSYLSNNYIYSNRIYQQDSGIYLGAENPASSWQKSYIYNNTIISCGYGIMLSRMHSQFIYINNISNNNVGILLYKSSSNIIRYNTFSSNNWSSINLTSYSSNNLIENNVISMGNQTGIYIYGGSDGNKISRNSIENNSGIGINITSATGNQIHHNNFINNTQNAYDSTISLNNWDDGVEGNYWSDYLGTDDDSDGFGEDPYVVPGGGSRDWHPFMYMVDIIAPYIIITSPANGEIEVPQDTTISITFSKEMNKTAVEGAISISGGLTPTGFTWDSSNETVTFTPSSNLDSGAKYTVTITIDAMDVLGNRLEKTYTFSFTAVDIDPPVITNTVPFDGETGVARNADVVVTFSESMQASSINFTCTPNPGGWIISWEMNNTIAIFSHNDFGNEATYSFQITTGKDLAGLDLVAGPVPNPWTFSTPDVLGPVITSTSPVDGSQNVSVSVSIVVNFSEEIDISSVTYTCSSDPLGWSVVWTNNDKTATFTHNDFTEKTLYSFHISAAKDIPGNDLASGPVPNPWSFTTTGDYTAPQITLTSPTNNEFNVDTATDVIVTFNEVMDNSTLNYICIPDPGGWTVSWSGGNTIATFSHATFENATSYTFHINTARDLSGNNIVPGPVPNPWSFATVGDLEPPQIISTSPEDNEIDVDPSRDVVVIFSETMNTSTLNYSCNPDPGVWSESWSNGNTVVTFSHNQFAIETTYTFRIDAGKDISGNNLVAGPVPNPWFFTTIGDLVAPEIISTLPSNNDIDVGLDMNIVVTFNEAMDTSTIFYICTPNPGGWSESWSNGNTVVTFSHNTFTVGTEYTFHVYAGKDDSGNDLNPGPVPNPWSFTTVTGDLIGPEIISTSPANNEIDVGLDTNIIVTFNEAMDTSSLNYYCTPDPVGWFVGWSNGDTVATFSHNIFTGGTDYTFHVYAAKDVSGNDLTPGLIPNPWSFTTLVGDIIGPEIISTSPVNNEANVNLDANIVITFDIPMDTSSITYICIPDPGGWYESWSTGDTVATFTHNPFAPDTIYNFFVIAAKDTAENDLAGGTVPNPWSFITIEDSIPPQIDSTSPANNEIDINLDSIVAVTFTEAMDTSTLNYTCTPDPGGWTVSWSNGDTVVTFLHDPFALGTTYTFHITAGKDLSGNALTSGTVPHSWSFTTISIDSLIVTPSEASITVNGTTVLIAQAYDAQNNPVSGITYTWSVDNVLGTVFSQNQEIAIFQASSNTGTCIVNVSAGGKSANAVITIISEESDVIESEESRPEDMDWISFLWLLIITACIVIIVVVLWKKGPEEDSKQPEEDATSEETAGNDLVGKEVSETEILPPPPEETVDESPDAAEVPPEGTPEGPDTPPEESTLPPPPD